LIFLCVLRVKILNTEDAEDRRGFQKSREPSPRAIRADGIEEFWALLKRGPYGIHHHISPKHLQRYVDAFALRCTLYGASFDGVMAHAVMAMVGKRLTYGALIHGA